MARGGICLNRAAREAVFSRNGRILRAFAVAVCVELLALPLLVAAGVEPLEASVDRGAPGLLPVAQLVGGLLFGVGMALAGGCIAGILWKSGAGSVATAIAIVGFAAGELLVRGLGDALIADLDAASAPAKGSLTELTGAPYAALALPLGAVGLALLLARSKRHVLPGLGLGVVATLAWVAADAAGYGYGLGFVGAAEGTRAAVADGGEAPFQLYLALGVVAGAALGQRGPLRMPDGPRATRALAGGVLMGIGGSVAHGCNIGHGLTGVSLLSVGSLLAVSAMVVAALATWRLLVAPHPRLRGAETPEPSW
jgi:uncharacterized membrane protein YedE/YeeE